MKQSKILAQVTSYYSQSYFAFFRFHFLFTMHVGMFVKACLSGKDTKQIMQKGPFINDVLKCMDCFYLLFSLVRIWPIFTAQNLRYLSSYVCFSS